MSGYLWDGKTTLGLFAALIFCIVMAVVLKPDTTAGGIFVGAAVIFAVLLVGPAVIYFMN